jgi:Tfp pilus assembly protein PilZ
MPQTSRRVYPRQLRRLAVRFWRQGEERPRQGFTKNVSLTGAFVSTPDPAGRGERLRLEISDTERTAQVYAVVVHAHRVPPELRRFADSAMGLRFLGLDEVVGPFLGEEALQPEAAGEPSGRGASSAGGSSPATGEGLSGGGTGAQRIGTERGAGPAATYALAFASADDFLAVYRRDVANGGLFVTAERPARLDERVAVDLLLPGAGAPAVRVEGRVVQVVEPRPLASGRTAGGMGLELVDPDDVVRRLAPHVAAYER